jgi:endonuclease V-like protein UPF0215 family
MWVKKAIRMLGIAESFNKKHHKSVLTGVVQRSDLIIDGFAVSFPTVGGLDATDKVIEIITDLDREDINVLCISGVVISWYNVIDLNMIYEYTHIPLISLTYEESPGLLDYFKKNFPDDWQVRWEIHKKNGERETVTLKTGYSVFIRPLGIDTKDALKILNKFILEGRYPEPIRVARLIARKIARKMVT